METDTAYNLVLAAQTLGAVVLVVGLFQGGLTLLMIVGAVILFGGVFGLAAMALVIDTDGSNSGANHHD